uniref:RNA exonuclease 4 n=1 Tax=Oncorhynchus tshawytscha TaxID=74940 RepID=A0AAZ3RZP7_ONCTS
MSKVKPEKTDSAASSKTPESSLDQKKKKLVKKKFFEHTKKQPVAKDQGKTNALLPPKDAEQFSANWKTLLEVFKSNPLPVKNKPVTQNSKKEVPKKPTKDISKKDEVVEDKKPAKDLSKTVNDAKPMQVYSRKVGKDSAVPNKSQVNGKGPGTSGTEQPNAKKKKPNNAQVDGKTQMKKKKIEEVEEKKPTESDMWFDDVDPDDIEATVGTEAADIMRKMQGIRKTDAQTTEKALVKDRGFEGLTKAVAMDCEMVGVGPDGEDSIVARVSLVNQFGKCIYDKHVKPTEKVTDYRTAVSGIRPENIKNGENVKTVQTEVAEILQGRTLVGHAIHNDLKILLLDHPKKRIRDTQKYKPFKKIVKVQDAQATMRLYTMAKKNWEAEIKASHNNPDLTKKTKEPRKPKSAKLK